MSGTRWLANPNEGHSQTNLYIYLIHQQSDNSHAHLIVI